jgi:hypothetical protein
MLTATRIEESRAGRGVQTNSSRLAEEGRKMGTIQILAPYVGGIMLIVASYVGVYYALVDRVPGLDRGKMSPSPVVRAAVKAIFWPIHEIDRKMRPSFWNIIDL